MPKKKVWTQEEKNKIIDWYQNDGYTINYIAKQLLKCRESSISKILKDNNITIRRQNSGRVLNINQEKEVIDLYVNKKYSQSQIAEKFNCSTFVIHNILIRNNIPIVIQPRINKRQDECYFDKIDSENKAYWLGFIFSDGYIYDDQLSIEIHEKDIELLKRFKEELGLDSKISIRHRQNTDVCCIRLCSKHLCNSLAKYNIIPNKTQIIKHLPDIEVKWLPHFLRGLIDGDGWITIDKNGYYHIGFVSNYQSTCEDFKKYCNIVTNGLCKANIVKKGNNYCYQIQSKKATKQLANVLYKDSTIYLSRKYRLVEPLFDFKNDEDIV